MKKQLLLSLCLFCISRLFSQVPQGCNIANIRSAFAGAGHYTELTVSGQPCSLYFIDNNSSDAATAETDANSLGAHVVVFNDATENTNVVAALNAGGYLAGGATIWIGVKRVSTGNPLFYTLDGSTGSFTPGPATPSLYQNWAGGEPNNNDYQCSPGCLIGCNSYKCNNGEQCVQIYAGGQWNDLPCDQTSKSVIEVNLCPIMTASNDTIVCTNGSAALRVKTILGSSPINHLWNPGGLTGTFQNVSPLVPTTYTITATDRYGCYATETIDVGINPNCTLPPGPKGCGIQAIRTAFANAGNYTELAVSGQACSLYFVDENASDAATAEARANGLGAHTVVMNDAAENANVVAALNAGGYLSSNQKVWMGYKRTGTNAPTFYTLDGTNSSFTPGPATPSFYQNWNGGEPNNSGYTGCCTPLICSYTKCNGEQCVQIYSSGFWNDEDCSDGSSKSVVEVNLCPQLQGTTNDAVMCNAVPVTITTNTILGSTPYSYNWTPGGQNTPNITVTPPIGTTNYIARATDRYGCYGEDTTVMTVVPILAPTITSVPTPANICVGQNIDINFSGTYSPSAGTNWYLDGATLAGSSAVLPYGLSWSTPGVKNVELFITDQGCTSPKTTFPITVNPSPTPDAGPDLLVCSGLNANLGTAPAANTSYAWSPATGLSSTSIANPVFNLVNPGDTNLHYEYVVVATSNGCIGVDTVEITLYPPIDNNFKVSKAAICSIETDTITYTGKNGPSATYLWGFDGGTVISGSGQGPYIVQWATGGVKNVTLDVTENSCVATQGTKQVTVTQQPTADAGPDVQICSGKTANIGSAPVNGVSYTWNPTIGLSSSSVSDPIAGGVNPGTTTLNQDYIVVASVLNCISTDTVNITLYAPISNAFTVSQAGACIGLADTITYTGTNSANATYNWSFDGGSVINGATGQGPYYVQWATSGTKNITLDVTENNCTATQGTQQVTVNPNPIADAGPDVQFCSGQSTTIGSAAAGGVSYDWTPVLGLSSNAVSNPTVSGTNPGTTNLVQDYIVTANSLGCLASDTVTVTMYAPISSAFSITPASDCIGQNISIAYTGTNSANANYIWNFDGGVIVSGSGQGPYTINWATTGTKNVTLDVSENGCPGTQTSIPANIGTPPTVDAGQDQSICSGGILPIGSAPIAGYTYQWNTQAVLDDSTVSNPNFSYLNTGVSAQVFTLTVIASNNGCTASDAVNITVNPPQATTIIADQPTTFCEGTTVTLESNDPNIVAWIWTTNDQTQTITTDSSGTFALAGIDANQCLYFSNAITTTKVPNPLVGLAGTGIINETCTDYKDGSIDVQASSGTPNYQYNWSTTPAQTTNTAVNLGKGNYTVTVTDANSCTVTAQYTIISAVDFYLLIDSFQNASCFGTHDAAIFASVDGGKAPYSYLWSNGKKTARVNNLSAGSYTVTATDGNGCKQDTMIAISEPAEIVATTITDLHIEFNEQTEIDVTISPSSSYTYLWSPAASLNCTDCEDPRAFPTRTTTYSLIVTDEFTNCKDTTFFKLNVDPAKKAYIPNAFTPNNDSKNDVWQVFTKGVKYFEAQVWNRWGELVFQSSDIQKGWDGNFKGAPVQPGVYPYLVNITYLDGESVVNKGTLTVLK